MTPRRRHLAPLLLLVAFDQAAAAQTQPPVDAATPAQANDARARQGRFQAPPPPPPPPAPLPGGAGQPANNNQSAPPGPPQQRRQWRDLTDALLDLMVPRALLIAELVDDPLTTGFGNSDFVEPLLVSDPMPDDMPVASSGAKL